jgi:hypothetical protein
MNLRLFEELMELNQAFERVLGGLRRMEKLGLFQREIIRYARAEVESARVDANREFFDNFEQIVEQDAGWAYQFRRAYDRKTADVEDLYLEIKEREEVRKKKGLAPRLAILPNWIVHDEEQYDEAQARRRRSFGKRRRKAVSQRRRAKIPPNPEPSGVVAPSDTGAQS